jgi:hypothetical protein
MASRLLMDAIMASPETVSAERLERGIPSVRNHRVMLDADLAALYGVEKRALVQAVKRNIERFPEDFMLQLTAPEAKALKSQSVISKPGRGGNRHRPYAFTEQGVAMLSTVLRSPCAVQVNIEIIRTFVRLRQMLAASAELEKRLDALEARYDAKFRVVFDAIRDLMAPPGGAKPAIGFAR